jgi:hypothetical protein
MILTSLGACHFSRLPLPFNSGSTVHDLDAETMIGQTVEESGVIHTLLYVHAFQFNPRQFSIST